MPTALIIGASRGIGHEFVRQLLSDGWKVHATARDDKALEALRAAGAEALKLDVTIPESMAGLGWQLDDVKLDLAVYVAGIYGRLDGANVAPTMQDFDTLMHTNVLGAMQAIPMIAPLVEAAGGKLVCITSGMGSIGEAESSTAWVYRASKAALNMAVKSASFDYPQATLAVIDPGWVRTDMGGPNASLSVEQSVGDMLTVIDSLTPADSGSYRSHSGRVIAW
ncbi:SDR family oxidoreductase [Noviherbaspirillum cavernae]|uniref:SDR family oxidoreductase n=1 Tax=Noviherbaspirillum cavernae TaxID=2320862 RepID=A0A418X501_9BURK|nr:SDR family oxidoreductase [Noviherbaspirillum cavernae]RJG07515.1 SDR family oxidoreductase [Noviherbaspirillum cavernae]